jgi:hypothetical protein
MEGMTEGMIAIDINFQRRKNFLRLNALNIH